MTKTEAFIKKAKMKHGDIYGYSKSKYTGSKNKLIITCKEHGDFEQRPNNHLNGARCPICVDRKGRLKRRTKVHDFIKKVKSKHSDKYDYSKVVYNGNKNKIEVICKIHGSFYPTPNNHLKGSGCPECGKVTKGTIKFIKDAIDRHGSKYGYDKVDYKHSQKPIVITCKIHGDFKQKPNSHLQGAGCPICGKEKGIIKNTKDSKQFITEAKKLHANKYIYDKTNYVRNSDNITITCNEHGDFEQSPHSHLKGHGCPKCASIKRASKTKLSSEEYFKRVKAIHGNKYSYKDTKYIGINKPIEYICPEHGLIKQRADGHLEYGCELCGRDATKVSFEDFINRSKKIHGDDYIYCKDKYDGAKSKVKIKCKKHGVFHQIAQEHMRGQGCPICNSSKGELKINKILNKFNIKFIIEYKLPNSKLRFDFYLPDLNILIEYDGIQHFRPVEFFGGESFFRQQKERDKIKNILADISGYKLIRIPYTAFTTLENTLVSKINLIYPYTKDGLYFKNFLELAKHLNLPGDATPKDFIKYKTINLVI